MDTKILLEVKKVLISFIFAYYLYIFTIIYYEKYAIITAIFLNIHFIFIYHPLISLKDKKSIISDYMLLFEIILSIFFYHEADTINIAILYLWIYLIPMSCLNNNNIEKLFLSVIVMSILSLFIIIQCINYNKYVIFIYCTNIFLLISYFNLFKDINKIIEENTSNIPQQIEEI